SRMRQPASSPRVADRCSAIHPPRSAEYSTSTPIKERSMSSSLITDLLGILDELSGGVQPGFRPAHAKGLMCSGTFRPSPEAAGLTRAPHANRPSTPVTVRYSDSTGVPTIPDNDPAKSGPRGIAVRFHL